jgi:hypothetical protein
MNTIDAIQMIGTQRSGSNLLRLLLNQYPEIAAPHPPHILQRFLPLLPAYGDLSEQRNMEQLVDDVCTMVEVNPVPWNGVKPNRAKILENCRMPHLTEVFRLVYEEASISKGATKWMCKSMANVHYSNLMEQNGIHPVYLFLYRDGRDVACSFKKAVVGEKHIYFIAQQWKEDQEACLALKSNIEPARFIEVRYENLLQNPEAEMQRLSQLLHLNYNPDIFNYYQSEESRNTSIAGKMWENVAKPIFNNSKKFLKELSPEEIIIFEAVAGDILQKLGYEPEYPEESKNRAFSKNEIESFSIENKQLKELALLKADPEGMKLRKPQDDLINSVKNRIIAL